MAEQESKGATKPRRWLKILLVLSLALNLLIIGVIVGALTGKRSDTRINLREITHGPYARALSHEDRKAIGTAMRRELGTDRENIQKLRQNYIALLQALRSDSYDDAQVRHLIGEQQDFAIRRQNLGERLLLERFGTMTPGQRLKFANRLERALDRMRSGG